MNILSRLVKQIVPIAIATVTAVVVLVGYLFPGNVRFVLWRDQFVAWAIVVAAFAFLLGMVNVARVHVARLFRSKQKGKLYSLVLIVAVVTSASVTILPPWFGWAAQATRAMFDYVISPLAASLAALVVFTLTLAAFRLLRARRGRNTVLWTMIFVVTVVAVLATTTPPSGLVGELPFIDLIRHWIVSVAGMAGMRGLLLGVALGTLITALRVIVFWDRPHSDF